jgi:hypothetical protein
MKNDVVRQVSCPDRVGTVEEVRFNGLEVSYNVMCRDLVDPQKIELVLILENDCEDVTIPRELKLEIFCYSSEGAIYQYRLNDGKKVCEVVIPLTSVT